MHERGSAEVLQYQDFPIPVPGSNEVLISVKAASVNHTDIFHRTGQFYIQKPLPHILGMDVAGEIVEVGKDVTGWKIGERVVATFEALGRERNGAYAEYTTLPENELFKIPDGLNYEAAASIGLAFTTAWIALFETEKIGSNESVVIHAASSGVGTAAIQIARYKNAQVIAISEQSKADRLIELGADVVIDRSSKNIAEQVMRLTKNKGASIVLELVGKSTLQTSLEMLADCGRIICVGTLSGDVASVNIMDLIMKRGTIKGSFAKINKDHYNTILQLFAEGIFQPTIDSIMPLQDARIAHKKIEAKEAFGKIILVP